MPTYLARWSSIGAEALLITLSNKVGETSGGKNIAGLWKNNYSNVFDSVTNTCDKAEVEE